MIVHFKLPTEQPLFRWVSQECLKRSGVKQQLVNAVRILAIFALTLTAVGSGQTQGVSESHTQNSDGRILNKSYRLEPPKLELVEPSPELPYKAAVYSSSIIEAPGIRTQNSPDIPVTEAEDTTQSENSIFVHPLHPNLVLNSNISTDWPFTMYIGVDYFYSEDYGQTWVGDAQAVGGPYSFDPAVAIGRNDWFYLGYITDVDAHEVAYSTNRGENWTLVPVSDPPPGAQLDKNHLWIDNSLSSPHQGNLYTAWTQIGGSPPNPNAGEVMLSYSTNSGVTWFPPANISSEVALERNQGVNIQTGPNGNVYAVWAIYDSPNADEIAIGFTKSTNGGANFEQATRIITDINGIAATGTHKDMKVNSFPVMAVDISGGPNTGAIYVVWANLGVPGVNRGPDIDVYMSKSTDYGSSWSEQPVRVNQDPLGMRKEHYFPWITCDPITGDLHVIFYDDRNVAPTDCEVFVATSRDGGDTWHDFKVSDVSFTPEPIPEYGDYFGDYLGISARAGKVYPIWTDNRTGRALAYVSPFNAGPYEISDDPLALAYNGNRHLVRIPNTEELHLVYTNEGSVINQYSANGGTDWSMPEIIGEGKFPALALDGYNQPSVTWTDEDGGLWYRRKISATNWSDIFHLDNPTGPEDRHLNSPPAIVIDPARPNTVHILVTRSGTIPPHKDTYSHTLEDFSFPIDDPGQGWFDIIEEKVGPLEPPLRTFPSIARCEVNNSLQATWQRVDTVCYATKPRYNSWVNWGPQFGVFGLHSSHSFVETYGDSIVVVWQRVEPRVEEIRRAARQVPFPFQASANLTQTANLESLYPINASNLFTVFTEEPTQGSPYDIFYKTGPYDDRINISNTSSSSLYPHAVARFCDDRQYLYTTWLEGEDEPYEIKFRKLQHLDPEERAFMTSVNGLNPPSPYLVTRDSFIDSWQIPVDIGNMNTTYRFPLVPGYAYKAKAIVYHETYGPWSGRIKIDNTLQFNVTYNANVPETLECWIPPALYEDSVLIVSFNRIAGDFAAIGAIYIYRYEYESGGGPMSQQNQPMHNASITVFPNPFTDRLTIAYQTANQNKNGLKVYDVCGRLIKHFALPSHESLSYIIWDGIDDQGRAVPQGVYFLRVDNPVSGDILCQKVLKVK